MTTTAPDPWCCCCTRASPTVACGHPWRRHWPGASGWCATTYAGTASPRRHRSPSPITRTSRDYSTTWASSAPRWPAARSALEQIDVRALDPPANERLARVTVPALVTAGAADIPEIRRLADRLAATMPRARRLPDIPMPRICCRWSARSPSRLPWPRCSARRSADPPVGQAGEQHVQPEAVLLLVMGGRGKRLGEVDQGRVPVGGQPRQRRPAGGHLAAARSRVFQ